MNENLIDYGTLVPTQGKQDTMPDPQPSTGCCPTFIDNCCLSVLTCCTSSYNGCLDFMYRLFCCHQPVQGASSRWCCGWFDSQTSEQQEADRYYEEQTHKLAEIFSGCEAQARTAQQTYSELLENSTYGNCIDASQHEEIKKMNEALMTFLATEAPPLFTDPYIQKGLPRAEYETRVQAADEYVNEYREFVRQYKSAVDIAKNTSLQRGSAHLA
jgi:hypothetical protein